MTNDQDYEWVVVDPPPSKLIQHGTRGRATTPPYLIDERTGDVEFLVDMDIAVMEKIREDARRSRSINRGDIEEVLAALGRIEKALQRPQ